MILPGETANEPYYRHQPNEGWYLELSYRVRAAGEAEFGEERSLCVSDTAFIGRLDPDQWAAPEIGLPAHDSETSRSHGAIALERSEGLRLTYFDLGSENGTFIGTEPVPRCPVVAGLRLRLGKSEQRTELLFVAVRAVAPQPADLWPNAQFGDLRGESVPMRRLLAAVAALAASGAERPLVVIQGASGSGKKAVLWELLRRWTGREVPSACYVDCRWISLDADQLSLNALLSGPPPQALVLDNLYGLSIRHQTALCLLLQTLIAGKPGQQLPRVVVFLRGTELDRQALEIRDKGLFKLLRAAPTLRLPSTAICGPAEVRAFVALFLARYQRDTPSGSRFAVSECLFASDAVELLAHEPWPCNWGQLQTVVEAAALATAMDGRRVIETADLQIGFSEEHLPLNLLYEMPFQEAAESFRRAYIMSKMRKYAGTMSWIAPAMGYTKRGLLKMAHDIDMYDGEQVTLPTVPTWNLHNPRYTRDTNRIRVALPSGMAWLYALEARHADADATRSHLLALLDHYPAASVEQAIAALMEGRAISTEALDRALRLRRPRRRPSAPAPEPGPGPGPSSRGRR